MSEAPDLLDPVVGFRMWGVGGGGLRATGAGRHDWDGPREVRATCYGPAGARPAPHPDPCACGYNAWHEVVWASSTATVSGAVACRGTVYVHANGFRAEYARPIALCWADYERPGVNTLTATLTVERSRDFVRWFAARVGLPAMPASRLRDFALEHGSPVPAELRPPVGTR